MEAARALRLVETPAASGKLEAQRLHAVPPPETGAAMYADYQLPDYEKVAGQPEIRYGNGLRHDGYGETFIDQVDMHDEAGTSYDVMRCQADNPASDVWVVKDTAWSTQVTGLNTDVARKLMKLGFNVLIKGPEKGSSLPLSHSAYNTHLILDAYDKLGDLDASHIAVEGYSRGSMVGFGTNGYADRFDRQVIYSNLTDPCVGLPVKVKPMDLETAKKAVTLPLDLTLLGASVLKGIVKPGRGVDLLHTVDFSIAGAVQFYRTGKPLMNGEAGMMAARTPEDMQATVAFFKNCRVNDKEIYKTILGASRPGVRFVSPEGGHGGGIDERIIGNIAVRFGRLGEELIEKEGPQDLDYRYITYGEHVA